MKHLFVPVTSAGRWVPDFAWGLDLAVLIGFAAASVAVAVARLRLREG